MKSFFLWLAASSVLAGAVRASSDCQVLDSVFQSLGYTSYNRTSFVTDCCENDPRAYCNVVCTNGSVTSITANVVRTLNGSIPDIIGQLVNLQYLSLRQNKLTGPIPESIGNLKNLTELDLGENQFNGTIPASIGNLTKLEFLSLPDNQLTGPIPDSIGNLVNLKTLYLGGSNLTGTIPSSIGNLVNLQALYLSLSQVTGPIPEWIGNLTKLETLALSYNQLNGSIPETIGKLSNLNTLFLNNNLLSGSVPESIVSTNLTALGLGINQFSGPIPAVIRMLSNLTYLDLRNSDYTGFISDIGNLTQLQYLFLDGNQLQGSIPDSICTFSSLLNLTLSKNELTGSIPNCIGNLTALEYLTLSGNQLSGSIPTSIGNLTKLQELDLSENLFTGNIPDFFNNFQILTYVSFGGNNLRGSLPNSLSHLPSLKFLNVSTNYLSGNLSENFCGTQFNSLILNVPGDSNIWSNPIPSCLLNNSNVLVRVSANECQVLDSVFQSLGYTRYNRTDFQTNCCQVADVGCTNGLVTSINLDVSGLTGSIPDSFCNLGSLITVSMHYNKLTGSIPNCIGNLKNLIELNLDANQFNGSIPASIGNLTKLETLDLGSNQLTGPIPDSIGNLVNLKNLNLEGSNLNGTIPSSIGNLVNLQGLFLAATQVTGSIPEWIVNLTKLETLFLSYNQLNGSIPETIGKLTNLNNLYLDHNSLTGNIPASIGNLSHLKVVLLNNNLLSGSVPESIVSTNLTALDLSDNQLSGPIPASIGNLSNLNYLDLSDNYFMGPIFPLNNLSSLAELHLDHNQFTGSIPDSICTFSSLLNLTLSKNQLTGSIPNCIGNLTALKYLDISQNSMDGSIPPSICNLNCNELILNAPGDNNIWFNPTIPSCLVNNSNVLINIPSPFPSGTVLPSPSVTVTPQASSTPSASPTASPSQFYTPSISPSVSPSASITPSITPSTTASPSQFYTPSISPSATASPSNFYTPSPSSSSLPLTSSVASMSSSSPVAATSPGSPGSSISPSLPSSTPSASPSNSSSSGSPSPVGAIAGGVVGGLAFLGIAAAVVFFLMKRRDRFGGDFKKGSVESNHITMQPYSSGASYEPSTNIAPSAPSSPPPPPSPILSLPPPPPVPLTPPPVPVAPPRTLTSPPSMLSYPPPPPPEIVPTAPIMKDLTVDIKPAISKRPSVASTMSTSSSISNPPLAQLSPRPSMVMPLSASSISEGKSIFAASAHKTDSNIPQLDPDFWRDCFKRDQMILDHFKLTQDPEPSSHNNSAFTIVFNTKNCIQYAAKLCLDKEIFDHEIKILTHLGMSRCEHAVAVQDFRSIHVNYRGKQIAVHVVVTELLGKNVLKFVDPSKPIHSQLFFIKGFVGMMMEALESIHSKNIVHGDLKPSHFLAVTHPSTGQLSSVKLIDFDNSYNQGERKITRITRHYASPEVLNQLYRMKRTAAEATTASDIWALGLICYELFTGRKPWEVYFERHWKDIVSEMPDDPAVVEQLQDELWLAAVVSDEPLDLPSINIPQAHAFVQKMLVKSSSDRATIFSLLKSSFMTGGLDTQQVNSTIGGIRDDVNEIKNSLKKDAETIKRMIYDSSVGAVVPTTFVILPVQKKLTLNYKSWTHNHFRLHLMCDEMHVTEHPGYDIDDPKKFVAKVAPLLSMGLKVLSVAIALNPMHPGGCVPAAVIDFLDATGERAIEKFETIKATVEGLYDQKDKNLKSSSPAKISSARQQEVVRELQAFLEKIDPSRQFGNLEAVHLENGERRWYCPECVARMSNGGLRYQSAN